MSSPESLPIVTAPSFDYDQVLYSHGDYKFTPQYSNTYGQPMVLGQSQIPVIINLSRSYLTYTVYLPQGQALTHTWLHQQFAKGISHLQFYAGNQVYMLDIDNF